jgi:hypothetical protein
MSDHSKLKQLAEDADLVGGYISAPDFEAIGLNAEDAAFAASANPKAVLALIAENEALRRNANRYLVLRQADVDTIHNGGLFAGLTPDNIVINGHHLDEQTDAVIAARKEVTS